MSQDHDVKVALRRDARALLALLQLMYSDYPVIQYHALVALSLAAENGRHTDVGEAADSFVFITYLPCIHAPFCRHFDHLCTKLLRAALRICDVKKEVGTYLRATERHLPHGVTVLPVTGHR